MTRRRRATASRAPTRWACRVSANRVDFKGQLTDGVVAISSTSTKGVVLLAQCGDDVGKRLDGADGFFDEGGEDEQQNEEKHAEGGKHRPQSDVEESEDSGAESEECSERRPCRRRVGAPQRRCSGV